MWGSGRLPFEGGTFPPGRYQHLPGLPVSPVRPFRPVPAPRRARGPLSSAAAAGLGSGWRPLSPAWSISLRGGGHERPQSLCASVCGQILKSPATAPQPRPVAHRGPRARSRLRRASAAPFSAPPSPPPPPPPPTALSAGCRVANRPGSVLGDSGPFSVGPSARPPPAGPGEGMGRFGGDGAWGEVPMGDIQGGLWTEMILDVGSTKL